MMGPSTGHVVLDDLTRTLALDLLIDPAGARMLATAAVACAQHSPHDPQPLPSLIALFEQLLMQRSGPCRLEVDVFDAEGGGFMARLFPQCHNSLRLLADECDTHGRWRTKRVLGLFLCIEAFEQKTDTGLLLPLQLSRFRANALLQHFYQPLYMTVLALEHVFVKCHTSSPLYADGSPSLENLCLQLAAYFAKCAVELEAGPIGGTLKEIARTMSENALNQTHLARYFQTLAHRLCLSYKKVGSAVIAAMRARQSGTRADANT